MFLAIGQVVLVISISVAVMVTHRKIRYVEKSEVIKIYIKKVK